MFWLFLSLSLILCEWKTSSSTNSSSSDFLKGPKTRKQLNLIITQELTPFRHTKQIYLMKKKKEWQKFPFSRFLSFFSRIFSFLCSRKRGKSIHRTKQNKKLLIINLTICNIKKLILYYENEGSDTWTRHDWISLRFFEWKWGKIDFLLEY